MAGARLARKVEGGDAGTRIAILPSSFQFLIVKN